VKVDDEEFDWVVDGGGRFRGLAFGLELTLELTELTLELELELVLEFELVELEFGEAIPRGIGWEI